MWIDRLCILPTSRLEIKQLIYLVLNIIIIYTRNIKTPTIFFADQMTDLFNIGYPVLEMKESTSLHE